MMENTNTNPLSIDYGLHFDENDIKDCELRAHVNSVVRKLRAIAAISTILQADTVEKDAQDHPLCLTSVQSGGLLDAIIELSQDGNGEAEKIGARLIELGKH